MKKISMLFFGLLIFSSFILNAQPRMNRMGANAPMGKKMLKLTEEQEKKFDDITYKHQQAMIDINAKIQKNRLEIKKLIDDGKVEEKALLNIIDENTKLQSEIKTSAVKRWFEINKILTDEQKATWQKMLSKVTGFNMMQGKMKAGMMMNRRGAGRMPMQGK